MKIDPIVSHAEAFAKVPDCSESKGHFETLVQDFFDHLKAQPDSARRTLLVNTYRKLVEKKLTAALSILKKFGVLEVSENPSGQHQIKVHPKSPAATTLGDRINVLGDPTAPLVRLWVGSHL